jgi:hypothetical protein
LRPGSRRPLADRSYRIVTFSKVAAARSFAFPALRRSHQEHNGVLEDGTLGDRGKALGEVLAGLAQGRQAGAARRQHARERGIPGHEAGHLSVAGPARTVAAWRRSPQFGEGFQCISHAIKPHPLNPRGHKSICVEYVVG